MELGEMIRQRLIDCKELSSRLALYAMEPAIFDSEFPPDQQPGWEGTDQYPRICYRVDMQVNQERASSGMLHVTVYSRNAADIDIMGDLVRRCLKDVLMKPSDEAPFCVAWSRSEPYALEGMAVIWKDIIFDILEYPSQETTDPDPVMAVSTYIKYMYPESVVLGIDHIGDYTIPAEKPVFYCRLQDIEATTGHCMNTISWFRSRVAVHLLYPNALARLKMIAAIHQRMAVEGEIIMLDQSPMYLENLVMNNKADYLREGQLSVTGKYGCLRGGEKKHNITGIRSASS